MLSQIYYITHRNRQTITGDFEGFPSQPYHSNMKAFTEKGITDSPKQTDALRQIRCENIALFICIRIIQFSK